MRNIVSEPELERMVKILGEGCAAYLALRDCRKIRAMGDTPVVYSTGSSLLVNRVCGAIPQEVNP